jgi:hypothetical protein
LWHWPIFVIFRWTFGLDTPYTKFAAIVITAFAGVLSYIFIECRFHKINIIKSKPDWYIVSRGAVIIIFATALSALVFMAQPYASLSVTKDRSNWYPYSQLLAAKSLQSTNSQFENRKIFVLGDSHAGAYGTMLQMIGDNTGVSVQQHSLAGCSVASLIRETSQNCTRLIESAIQIITSKASAGDIVLLASLRVNKLGDQWATFDESEVEQAQRGSESVAQRYRSLGEAEVIISKLESASLTVIIDAPKPVFKSPPFRCSDWFNASNTICNGGTEVSRDFLLNHRELTMESLTILARKHPKLIVWDPFPILCPKATCAAFDNGLPVFFDGDHLSSHGNRMLYPSFLLVLKSIWHPAL